MTPEELTREIEEDAGIGDENLVHVVSVVWFDPREQHPSIWKHLELVPNNPSLRIYLMFQDETEVRVYALPSADPPAGQKPMPPQRYSMPKSQCLVVESMDINAFKRETAIELRILAGVDDDEEVIECPKCGEENPDTAAYCHACGERLPEEQAPTEEPPKPPTAAPPTTAAQA
jgi:zinc-ribbon domain